MDMEELFMMFAILTGVAVVLWTIVGVLKKKQNDEDARQPVKTEHAKLVDMQQVPAGQIVIGEIPVMFELDDGQRIRLAAKAQNSLVVGDVGMLTWQGRKILKFERDRIG